MNLYHFTGLENVEANGADCCRPSPATAGVWLATARLSSSYAIR